MEKETVVRLIQAIGVLPVINIKRPETAEPLAQTLISNGIPAIEVLCRNEYALDVIAQMKKNHPEMAVGAGTVLTLAQAKAALEIGADFIVSPGYDQKIVDWCNEQGVLCVPGCSGATEIQAAYISGLRVVKFFPASALGGLKAIESYASVFAGMKFLPTGGISMSDLSVYLQSPAIAAVGGGLVAPTAELESGNFAAIAQRCQKAMEVSLGFRLAHVGINASGSEDAMKIATTIATMFQMPVIDKSRSTFAGEAVEVFKENGPGKNGHIGFKTNSVDRAVHYLKTKGIGIRPETAGYDANGNMKYVYLDVDIAGFAIHLC